MEIRGGKSARTPAIGPDVNVGTVEAMGAGTGGTTALVRHHEEREESGPG